MTRSLLLLVPVVVMVNAVGDKGGERHKVLVFAVGLGHPSVRGGNRTLY